MLSNKWKDEFDKAVLALSKAAYRSDLATDVRVESAIMFKQSLDIFEHGGLPAKELLIEEIQTEDAFRCNTAARLFLRLAPTQASDFILMQVKSGFRLFSPVVLRQLHFDLLSAEEAKALILSVPSAYRTEFSESVLSFPQKDNLLIKELVYSSDIPDTTKQSVVKSIARWNQSQILLDIIDGPDIPSSSNYPEWLSVDIKLETAFFLGLMGNQEAVDFLIAKAESETSLNSAHALVRLAWLGIPDAASLSAKMLTTTDPSITELVLDAMGSLRCAGLGNVLLEFVGNRPQLSTPFSSVTLEQMAYETLVLIFGSPSYEELSVDYPAWQFSETLTDSTAQELQDFYESMMTDFIPTRRYLDGKLLSADHYIQGLYSPHAGPKIWSAFGCQAILGEHHSYDPDLDLVSNLDSIADIEKRISEVSLINGKWIYKKKYLPDPVFPL